MFADTIYDLYRKGNGIPERRAEIIALQQQAVFPRADFAAITRPDNFEDRRDF